jgi:hypothetical protein
MGELTYKIGRPTEEEQVTLDFQDGLSRSVDERISLGLIFLGLPVIDDVPYRVFENLDQYRMWADRELPRYLGYYRP